MKICTTIIAVWAVFCCSSLAAEYCVSNEGEGVVGCSLMVRTAGPMDPILIFVAKKAGETRVWQLSVRILFENWAGLQGDSEIRVDGGDGQDLKFVNAQKSQVTQDVLSESAIYAVSEGLLSEIARSSGEVSFGISTSAPEPIEIAVSSDKFMELEAFLVEVNERL
jgi:hypothetical protein